MGDAKKDVELVMERVWDLVQHLLGERELEVEVEKRVAMIERRVVLAIKDAEDAVRASEPAPVPGMR